MPSVTAIHYPHSAMHASSFCESAHSVWPGSYKSHGMTGVETDVQALPSISIPVVKEPPISPDIARHPWMIVLLGRLF